ncbi:dihydrofolate reductase [bacterium]|nr:dihydrofolate reductase [bacterium]
MSRRVVLYVANSLDGYIAREDGSVDWLFDPYAHGYEFFYEDVDTVIMGRKTYDQALSFEEAPYSSKRAIIFSRTAKPSPYAGLEYTTEPPQDVVRKLKEEDGGMIWLVGGREISELLIANELVDELIVSIHPKILISGIPLVASKDCAVDLKLVTYEVFKSGLVQLRYEIVKKAKDAQAAETMSQGEKEFKSKALKAEKAKAEASAPKTKKVAKKAK